ncbi:hypothetical protein LINPERHAP1_LOCUS24726 [Linum perenne]
MNWTRVVYETDCQVVIQAVEKGGTNITEFGRKIEVCKSLLQFQPHAEVVFIRRNGNRAAHAVARRTIHQADTVIGSAAPDWLCNILSDHCSTMVR